MTIIWYIDDGYAHTEGRPHSIDINDSDLAELETIEEKREYIHECIQQQFNENISWFVSDYGNLK